MAQILSRVEVSTLISTALDEAYEVEGKGAASEAKAAYSKFMDVIPMDRGQFINYRLAGFGQHAQRTELELITYDDYAFGETQTVNPLNWALGLRVSQEAMEDLQANPYGDFAQARLAAYSEVSRRFRKSATWTVEVQCANIFINCTSTAAAYVQRDGLALGSASHVSLKNPVTTWSNLPTAASLSHVQIMNGITSLMTIPDDTGNFVPIEYEYKVLVSPYNYFRLTDILKTKGQVDTNNNNTNPIGSDSNFTIKPVVSQYLGATYKGFHVIAPSQASLEWRWRIEPEFTKEADFEAIGMKYRSRFRGVAFTKDAHGVICNTGA